MSESAQRRVRFNYKENANLVLHADYTLFDRRSRDEPTGEVQSLRGRVKNYTMGDKALRAKPPKKEIKSSKKIKDKDEVAKTKNILNIGSIGDIPGLTYHPKSKETQKLYELFVNLVQQEIGFDHSREILWGSAEEIMYILKNKDFDNKSKKKEINDLIGEINEETFSAMLNLSIKLDDFTNNTEDKNHPENTDIDDTYGINVRFDESDESESEEEIRVSDSDDEKAGTNNVEQEEKDTTGPKKVDDIAEKQEVVDSALDLNEIDAFWLQRKISSVYSDPNVAQEKSQSTLDILINSKDSREIENRLIAELGYQLFDLIKLLRKHRYAIYYCIQLASTSIYNRDKIEQEINQSDNPEIRSVMEVLRKEGKLGKNINKPVKSELSNEVKQLEDDVQYQGRNNIDPSNLKNIDINDIAFYQGSLLMSNKKCILPDGSTRQQHAKYEEVVVPAQKQPQYSEDEKLKLVEKLPLYMQPAFEGFKALNRIQSQVFDKAANTDKNLLICAPTGAGKTNIALLCILREIGKNTDKNGVISLNNFKIVYIAPMKSLVQEMTSSFSKRLEKYGIRVEELTGDHSLTYSEISDTQVLVCTPEKWDIITRKGDERSYNKLVSLIIFDEVHLLHDERGPIIESLVIRMQTSSEYGQKAPRTVALSATLPNYEDVCLFLGVDIEEGLFHFDNRYRPVPLTQNFIGITEKKPLKAYQIMNDILYEKVLATAANNQVLIFVHSRKETGRVAKILRDTFMEKETMACILAEQIGSAEVCKSEADQVKDGNLKNVLPYGFAIHHAGMSKVDRTLVEDLFVDKHIKVLVSTSTLAWGVNLPAHTVIIRGTQVYNPTKSKYVELGLLDIMQMLGRAGRPQYDSKGNGILITSHSQLQYYLSVMNQQLPVESQMVSKLPDCMNAEIALRNIRNITEAINWLTYSYLYIRLLRNPQLYGVSYDDVREDKKLKKFLSNLAHSSLIMLEKSYTIKYDKKTGVIQPTELSKIASYFYCTHKSIERYSKLLKPHIGEIELLRVFSQSGEFAQITVKDEEKIELQKLVERVPIPVKESVEEPSAKINVLLQAYISHLKLDGFAMGSDMVYISSNGPRLFRAIFTICLEKRWCRVALKALDLSKCISTRMWSIMCPLRQFKNIPEEVILKLEKRNLPWDVICEMDSNEIGEILRLPKIGKNVHKYVHLIPRLDISASVVPITRTQLKIDLKLSADFNWDQKLHGTAQFFWILVADQDGDYLIYQQKVILKEQNSGDEMIVSFQVSIGDPVPPQYFIYCTSDSWLGSTAVLPISFHKMIVPEKFLPPTEILDLQPLPIFSLKKKEYEELYKNEFSFFNSIQTQTFSQLYSSDDSVLICSPHSSGKIVCAEIAILRYFTQNFESNTPLIFITQSDDFVKNLALKWSKKFGKLDKKVQSLTGSLSHDMNLLNCVDIIISTPNNWDSVSRRWKQNKILQNIKLYILYGLENLYNEKGSIFEIIGSRIRYVALQTENICRIIGLSHSIFNAKDIAQWLGVSQNHTFNFPPSARPIPLEFQVQLFDQSNYNTRIFSMIRSSFKSLVNNFNSQSSIVIVSSHYYAELIAYSYLQILVDCDSPDMLLGTKENLSEIQVLLKGQQLKELVQYGIGIVSESLIEKDIALIASLFKNEALKLCFVTREMISKIDLNCYLLMFYDLQYFNGSINDYSFYSKDEILQCLGLASRPNKDKSSKILIFSGPTQYENMKKSFFDPITVESFIDATLSNHINSEIVTKTIENKQDAIDYLTWTFLYRRITQNPNFYGLSGVSHRHISDFLSHLVESSIETLENNNCVEVKEEIDTSPTSLGMISAYYGVGFETISIFSQAYTDHTKLKGLLEVITNSNDFSNFIYVRENEFKILKEISQNLPYKSQKFQGYNGFRSINTKAMCLIQSHLSRLRLSIVLKKDLVLLLPLISQYVFASVDILATSGWLTPVLTCMELSQYIYQATWPKDAVFAQIPHLNDEKAIKICKDLKMTNVYDIIENVDSRQELFKTLNTKQQASIIQFCNSYPNIEVEYSIDEKKDVYSPGEFLKLLVTLSSDQEDDNDNKICISPLYPQDHENGWWLVVGIPEKNLLLSIKKLNTKHLNSSVKMNVEIPDLTGKFPLNLYFISDCYIGSDQEFSFDIKIE